MDIMDEEDRITDMVAIPGLTTYISLHSYVIFRQYDNGYRGQRNSGPRMNGYSNNMGSRNGGTGGLRGGRGGGPGPGLQNNMKRNSQPSNNAPFQPWNGPPTNQFNNMKIS